MTSSELSALLVLATVSSFTPGPNTTLSTAMAANHGLGALITESTRVTGLESDRGDTLIQILIQILIRDSIEIRFDLEFGEFCLAQVWLSSQFVVLLYYMRT